MEALRLLVCFSILDVSFLFNISFFSSPLSYDDATQACGSLSMSLIKVDSDLKYAALVNTLNANGVSTRVFIGLRSYGPDHTIYYYTDGSTASYFRWQVSKGEPNNQVHARCVVLSRDVMEFRTRGCNYSHPYVCEPSNDRDINTSSTSEPYTLASPGNSKPYTLASPGSSKPYTLASPGSSKPYTLASPGSSKPYTPASPGSSTPSSLTSVVYRDKTIHSNHTTGSRTEHLTSNHTTFKETQCAQCICLTSGKKESDETFHKKLDIMRKDLRLDKRTLSKSKRQKFSAADNRISSVSIGIVGASVLITALLMIILPDCMKVCRTVLKMKE